MLMRDLWSENVVQGTVVLSKDRGIAIFIASLV